MLTVTPETTVAELGSFLAERNLQCRCAPLSGGWCVDLQIGMRVSSGMGLDLVAALNDAIGKVRG